MDFLEKNASSFTPAILPAGNYWVVDRDYVTPVLGTVSYAGGKLQLSTATGSGNQKVRCVAPQ
jgi:hypothetical protein